jgi:uncharacterized protein with HEPN domain
MRDRMIHDYPGVNLEIVWQTVINYIPSLDRRIEEILTEINSERARVSLTESDTPCS